MNTQQDIIDLLIEYVQELQHQSIGLITNTAVVDFEEYNREALEAVGVL